jgi:hypothetical protein
LGDHLGDAQPLPERLQDIQRAKGPGTTQAPLRRLRSDLFGGTSLEDAAGELAQELDALGSISPSAIVDNADCEAFFVGILHALGQR